jgi:hypothetical protein
VHSSSKKISLKISFNYKRTMFTIPSHDGNRNGMASADQRHTSHPPIANSACAAAILNLGDHFAGPCINATVCLSTTAAYLTVSRAGISDLF